MIIEKLELENYRNFEKETVLLNPEVNVIRGMNAQGKTNFLEAIYLFSSAKSHRPVGEKDLIRFGQDSLKIKMDFRSGDIPLHGEINISQDEKRKIAFNGIPVKKNMLLSEYFKTVLFTPEDLEIIKGEKELRRNLLDDAICILKPNYAHILKDYNKCIKQKNSLLKSENISNLIPTIDIWNQRLCEYGARLVMYRDSFSKLLEKYCCQNMLDLTSGTERLEITYVPSVRYKDPSDIKGIKESFLKRMEELKMAELARGQALTGPHRDDLEFYINGNNAKVFASQGQQRSVVLCIKIAMVDIIKDRTGEYPVLLLDDIMSELDKSRQAYLTERIKGKQTIITCTETAHLRKSKRVSFFKVENGRFIEKPALQTINK